MWWWWWWLWVLGEYLWGRNIIGLDLLEWVVCLGLFQDGDWRWDLLVIYYKKMEGEMLFEWVSFGGVFQDQIGHWEEILDLSDVKGKDGCDLLCEFFWWWDCDDIFEWVFRWVFYETFHDEIELEWRFFQERFFGWLS